MSSRSKIGYDWLVEEVREVREKLLYPFAEGLAEDDLIRGTVDRVFQLGHLYSGRRSTSWAEWVRTQLLELAKERQDKAATKYLKILTVEAKRTSSRYDLPPSRIDLEDVVQEALERTLEKRDQLARDFEGQFVNSLKTLFARRARSIEMHHRAGLRDPQREVSPGPGDAPSPGQESLFDPQQTSASEALRRGRFLDRMTEAFAALESREREALRLRFVEGKSHRETGETLGVTQSAAGVIVSEALSKIRKHVGEADVDLGRFSVKDSIHEILQGETADHPRLRFLRRMKEAFAVLEDREREALRIYFGGNRDWAEVGSALGISPDEAGPLVTNAVDRIRGHVETSVAGTDLERFTVGEFIHELFLPEEASGGRAEPDRT